MQIGFSWIQKHKFLTEKAYPDYAPLNPFPADTLDQRLNSTTPEAAAKVLEALREPTNVYMFEAEHARSKDRTRDDYTLQEGQIIIYQGLGIPSYPKKGKLRDTMATLIMRLFQKYPRDYKVRENRPRQPKPSKEQHIQGLLFDTSPQHHTARESDHLRPDGKRRR
jgi:hypothetical protein